MGAVAMSDRPTKYQIMRINRGYREYINHKAELLRKIDCAELDTLRTLRARQADPEYPAPADLERLELRVDRKLHKSVVVNLENPPIPTSPTPIDRVRQAAQPDTIPVPRKGFIDRVLAWNFG
jgi:hypothetical protein